MYDCLFNPSNMIHQTYLICILAHSGFAFSQMNYSVNAWASQFSLLIHGCACIANTQEATSACMSHLVAIYTLSMIQNTVWLYFYTLCNYYPHVLMMTAREV